MPPLRTSMSNVKPMKTERTHEENQERAYIAASRRSDRSLEARVESARRASEIHKRRTGRSLRVTEQDVVNEEMYEEEDDDLPMQYRRLTAHLQTQNADFNRRIQAYLVNQVAMRQAVGNAAADTMYGGNAQYNQHGQYMNPGFMQLPQQQQQQQPQFQGSMMPPQIYNRTPSTYRQQPYPVPQNSTQSMRPNYGARSMSIATPTPDTPQYQHHHSQSAQTSPVDAKPFDSRRMSIPVKTAMPQTPVSQHGPALSSAHPSPVLSRKGSSSNVATPHAQSQHGQSPQQVPTPPEQHQQRGPSSRQSPLTSPFDLGFEQAMQGGFNPLSMQLPMESQQFLADMPSQDPSISSMMSQPSRYHYNPNGKPKGNTHFNGFQHSAEGLSQTLMPPQLDTNFGAYDPNGFMMSPQSAMTDLMFTPQTPAFGQNLAMPGFPMNLGDGYDNDLFKGSGFMQGMSGNVTPQEFEFSDLMAFPPGSQEDTNAA